MTKKGAARNDEKKMFLAMTLIDFCMSHRTKEITTSVLRHLLVMTKVETRESILFKEITTSVLRHLLVMTRKKGLAQG